MSSNTNDKHSLICIIADSDKNRVLSIKKIFETFYKSIKVVVVNDGKAALKLFEQKKELPILLLANLKLQGLDGKQLFKFTRDSKVNLLYQIAISESLPPRENVELLQSGLDDIITNPIRPDQLIASLRSAMKQIALMVQIAATPKEEELKHKIEFELSTKLSGLIELILEKKGVVFSQEKKDFWEGACRYVFEKMDGDAIELNNTLNASAFVHAYKIFIEDSKIQSPVMKNGYPSQNTMEGYPAFIDELFEYLPRLEKEKELLRYMYENLDGTGMPEKKRAWHIPLGSRTMRILVEFDEALKENKDDRHKSVETLFVSVKRLYDHTILAHLDQFMARKYPDTAEPEEPIKKNLLREGYVVSRNILSKDGLVIMPRKTPLEKEMIKTLWDKIEKDGMIGDIFIYSASKAKVIEAENTAKDKTSSET